MCLAACVESSSELGYPENHCADLRSLHAIEQTQLRRQHRNDGVGRLKLISTQLFTGQAVDLQLLDEAAAGLDRGSDLRLSQVQQMIQRLTL